MKRGAGAPRSAELALIKTQGGSVETLNPYRKLRVKRKDARDEASHQGVRGLGSSLTSAFSIFIDAQDYGLGGKRVGWERWPWRAKWVTCHVVVVRQGLGGRKSELDGL